MKLVPDDQIILTWSFRRLIASVLSLLGGVVFAVGLGFFDLPLWCWLGWGFWVAGMLFAWHAETRVTHYRRVADDQSQMLIEAMIKAYEDRRRL